MSLTDQPVSNNSAKKEHRRVPFRPPGCTRQRWHSLEWFGSRSAFLVMWSIVYAMLCIGALV